MSSNVNVKANEISKKLKIFIKNSKEKTIIDIIHGNIVIQLFMKQVEKKLKNETMII